MISIDKALEGLPMSKEEEVALYILRNTDGDTKIFSRTYKQIQKDINVSQVTIAKVFKILESNGTLIRAGVGKWYLPGVIGYEPESEEDLFLELK